MFEIPIPKRMANPRKFSHRAPGQKMAIAPIKRKIRVETFKDLNMYPVKATVKANNPNRAKVEISILSGQVPLINSVYAKSSGMMYSPLASFQEVNPVAIGREPEIEEAAKAARQTGGVTFESWDSQKMIM